MNTDPNLIPLGVVVGNDRERVSLLRKIGDDFMSLFGGSSGLMRKKMNDLIVRAKHELLKNVAEQFPTATAIYDAEFNFNTGNRFFEVVITGTAVIEKNKLNQNNNNNTRKNKSSKRSSKKSSKRSSKKSSKRSSKKNTRKSRS
jgi:uncharacterized protein YbjQ (UPF0145 family)